MKARGRIMVFCATCHSEFSAVMSKIVIGRGKYCCRDCYSLDRAKRGESGKWREDPMKASWRAMIQRCHNPKARDYKYYGARGIYVCERWRSFDLYLADMGVRPPGMTLDRVDNDGSYTPDNCRWASRADQNRNKRAKYSVFAYSSITA